MLFYISISVIVINRNICIIDRILIKFKKKFFKFLIGKIFNLFLYYTIGLGKIQISLLITLIFGYFFPDPFNIFVILIF